MAKIYLLWHVFQFRLELDGSLPISDGRFCCCKIEKPKERCDDVLIGGKRCILSVLSANNSAQAARLSASFRSFLSDKEKNIEPFALSRGRKTRRARKAARETAMRVRKFRQRTFYCVCTDISSDKNLLSPRHSVAACGDTLTAPAGADHNIFAPEMKLQRSRIVPLFVGEKSHEKIAREGDFFILYIS